MAATDQLTKAMPYIERLLDDDYIHESIGEAVSRGRAAYKRAAARRAAEAVADEKLYTQIREAAASVVRAVRGLRGEPPPKRRAPRLVFLALMGAGIAAGANESVRRRVRGLFSSSEERK